MAYWLMKSEPEEFSIDMLEQDGPEPWDGVRNYQARNFMRDDMRSGDGVLFYHSNCAVPGVVGVATIAREAYPDPTQFDPENSHFDPGSDPDNPRWLLVEVAFQRKLARTIALSELKAREDLDGLALIRRGNRLSVMPVSEEHWKIILSLEDAS